MDYTQLYEDADERPVICVFCGASDGEGKAHIESARALAREIHRNSMRLVYGGGTNGLMGEVARALVALSGPDAVHGIIPEPLLPEKSGKSVIDESVYGKTTVVKSMHERKKTMVLEVLKGGHGGGFVALSGGYGTFEELMEVATWNQLGKHSMPIVLLNVGGYWDGLLNWTANAVREKFVRPGNSSIIVAATTAEGVFDLLKTYKPATSRFRLSWERL